MKNYTDCFNEAQFNLKLDYRENVPHIMKNGKSSSKDALVKKSISSPKLQSR